MKQDFYVHIHPIGYGHEFLELNHIEKVSKDRNIPIIITPHVDDYNPTFYEKNLYNKMLEDLTELSKENNMLIKGAEFSAQTILTIPSEFVNSFDIKILSLHDKFKRNGYIVNEDNSVNVELTLAKRREYPWIYTTKYTSKDLLDLIRTIVSKYNIDIFGHIDRCMRDMLINPTEEEIDNTYKGILNIAKEHNICVEANLAILDEDRFYKLIDDCTEQDIKIVIGFDAHYRSDIKERTKEFNSLLELINTDNQVSLNEFLSMHKDRENCLVNL